MKVKKVINKNNIPLTFFCTVIVGLIVALFIPPLFGLAVEFDAVNYYTVISSLILASISLFILFFQHKKSSDEKTIGVRGYFEVNYLLEFSRVYPQIKPFIYEGTNKYEDRAAYIAAKFHSSHIATDASIKIDGNEYKLGVVVPKQLIFFEIDKTTPEFDIILTYNTIVGETITQKLTFKDTISGSLEESFSSDRSGNIWVTISKLFAWSGSS